MDRHTPLFTVVLAAMALAVAAATAATQPPPSVTKDTLPGVTNFSRVESTTGCAGAVTPEAMAAIKAAGFAAVINLRLASEPGADVDASRAAAERAGLRYLHLPFAASAPEPAVVDRFLAALKEPGNQPVFIHCASANRVGAVWLIKRVKQDGWPVDPALEEARAIGLSNAALTQFALTYLGVAR
jgi:uncharacterized protein (TIGR01244 family)